MLKMVGSGKRPITGKPVKVIMLGLSELNLIRLRQGQPITFKGEEVDTPDTDFVIFAGKTEASMARELEGLVGEQTQVKIDPRTTDA